jgi:Ca2+-transporting ATPase
LFSCTQQSLVTAKVNNGHGRAVVVSTGMHTEFGKTFQEMKDVEQRKTPLQVRFLAFVATLGERP